MGWLHLRFDFDYTAVRLLSKVIQVTLAVQHDVLCVEWRW